MSYTKIISQLEKCEYVEDIHKIMDFVEKEKTMNLLNLAIALGYEYNGTPDTTSYEELIVGHFMRLDNNRPDPDPDEEEFVPLPIVHTANPLIFEYNWGIDEFILSNQPYGTNPDVYVGYPIGGSYPQQVNITDIEIVRGATQKDLDQSPDYIKEFFSIVRR